MKLIDGAYEHNCTICWEIGVSKVLLKNRPVQILKSIHPILGENSYFLS